MFRRSLLLVAALAATAALSPAAQASIKPPAGNEPYFQSHARGVQIYTCGASGWTFNGPRADLYGPFGLLKIGTHFAGPTWRMLDGSEVVARAVDSEVVDPKAIPWLLLEKVSTKPGLIGRTTYLQRINTRGGLAPAASTCTTPGKVAEIPYTADYRFFKAA